MEVDTISIEDAAARAHDALPDTEWEGYGRPNKKDIEIVIASMIDYLDGLDGPAAVEHEQALLRVVNTGEHYEVWVKSAEIGHNV